MDTSTFVEIALYVVIFLCLLIPILFYAYMARKKAALRKNINRSRRPARR